MNLYQNSMNILLIVMIIASSVYAVDLSGEVYDNDLDPIYGVSILLDNEVVAKTDRNGTYSVNNIRQDTYFISFSAPGYKTHREQLVIAETDNRFDLILETDDNIEQHLEFSSHVVLNHPVTVFGESGGVFVPDADVIAEDQMSVSAHFLRVKNEARNNTGTLSEYTEDVFAYAVSYGFVEDLEIGFTSVDRFVLGIDQDCPTELLFHGKYRLNSFKHYVPLAVGCKVSSYENYYYLAATAYKDTWSENTVVFENTRDSDQYWFHTLTRMKLPKLHIDFLDSTDNTFIFETIRLNRKTRSFNFGLRFSRNMYSLLLFYQKNNFYDLNNDIISKNNYGLGVSVIF